MGRGTNITEQQIVDWAERQELPKVSELMTLCAGLDLPNGLKRVLCIESLPQAIMMPQSQKAKLAGMTVRSYYTWIHDQRFRDHAVEVARRAMGSDVPSVMAAFLRDAKKGNVTNQARVLEQVALLKDSNKKHIEFDDVSKPRFSPELSKEVAAVLNEAVESGETDDDPTPPDPDAEQ